MSIRTTQSAGLTSKHLNSFSRQLPLVNTITPWVRPADWVALPTIISTDQKFAGLFMVPVDSCFIALSVTGDYTVDWGDGNTINYATGVTAEHQYDYTNVSLGAVTTGGWKQAVIVITPQAGQNLTSINLNLAHSSVPTAGTTLNFVDIAVSGSLLATFTLGAPAQNVSARELAQINIIKSVITTFSYVFFNCNQLKSVVALDNSATLMNNMFSGCSSLQTVPLFNTSSATNTNNMFQNCISLQTVPLFNTSAATYMSSMFSSCYSLQTVPLFNTSAVTTMNNMFQSCTSLQTVPLFNTSSVTTMANMFSGCSSLQTVPLFNTSSVTTMANMFQSCRLLQTVPLFNTSLVNTTDTMFSGCSSLQTVPLFNTSSVIAMGLMFNGCSSLQSVPLFNTSKVTSMSNMFNACMSLQTVPLFNLVSFTSTGGSNFAASASSLVQGILTTTSTAVFTATIDAAGLMTVSAIISGTIVNFMQLTGTGVTAGASVTSFGTGTGGTGTYNTTQATVIATATAITGTMSNSKVSINYSNCRLSATALDAIYTALPTITSQTITVTGNWGTATDNPAIATAKGWTVTG